MSFVSLWKGIIFQEIHILWISHKILSFMKDRPVAHPQFSTFTKLRKFCFLLLKGSVWGTIPDPSPSPQKESTSLREMLDPPLINTLVLSPLSITLESASIEFLQRFTNNKFQSVWSTVLHGVRSIPQNLRTIQHFPGGGVNPKRGCQPIIWPISPENSIKLKKIVPPLP